LALGSPVTSAGAIIALAIAVACAGPLSAKEHRSREVTREFQREHPCPQPGAEELAEAHAGELFDEITSAPIVINK
jgi:hypothetical protein